jgi:hypothetical protein
MTDAQIHTQAQIHKEAQNVLTAAQQYLDGNITKADAELQIRHQLLALGITDKERQAIFKEMQQGKFRSDLNLPSVAVAQDGSWNITANPADTHAVRQSNGLQEERQVSITEENEIPLVMAKEDFSKARQQAVADAARELGADATLFIRDPSLYNTERQRQILNRVIKEKQAEWTRAGGADFLGPLAAELKKRYPDLNVERNILDGGSLVISNKTLTPGHGAGTEIHVDNNSNVAVTTFEERTAPHRY